MKRLRFGVVGCGALASLHQLPALRRCSNAELVAVVDVNPACAKAAARQFQVPEFYEDYRALAGRVEVALVATPNATHADIACALLEQGIHVLCEKPMATTLAEADRVLEMSARSGARLMAGHCLRFSPNLVMLKRLVSAGWLGSLVEMRAGIGDPYAAAEHRTDFRKDRRLSGGGVLVDLGIHLIDLAIWLAGAAPIRVAYDGACAPGWEVETDADVVLEFPNGVEATLSSSFTHSVEKVLVVRGTAGWAAAPLHAPTSLTLLSQHSRVCQKAGVQHLVLPDASIYDRQIEHFCDAVLSGGDFVIGPREVRAGIEVIEKCYGSEEAEVASA